ncbi:MAG: hypothetical protein ACLQBB_09170 [Solirubrobacteraceae bacterium]
MDRQGGRGRSGGEEISDELILAAIGRAVRHAAREGTGTPFWTLLEHLAIPARSSRARALRRRLTALEQRGRLRRRSLHGIPTWELTGAGADRLRRAERSPSPPHLPESPQHLAWRAARRTAGQELERFRDGLAETLAWAERMLAASSDGAGAPCSDAWFELGCRLQRECRRFGSAWHCLHEWPEPDDAEADLDRPWIDEETAPAPLRAGRAGRRNTRLWDLRD